jgi:sulfate adenylyltransferase subunit 1 (EFTu-like GTPase family)
MVVHRGDALSWYKGPTVLELLTSMPIPQQTCENFRMPVQYVARHGGKRFYMGRVESGFAYEGMSIQVFPSGQQTTITKIHSPTSDRMSYPQGDCVAFELAGDHDISRGDILACLDEPPRCGKKIQSQVCWFGPRSVTLGNKVLLQHGTRLYQAVLEELPPGKHHLKMNDISYARFRLAQDIHYDRYAECKEMGSFIVIDPATNSTIGAGTIQGGY